MTCSFFEEYGALSSIFSAFSIVNVLMCMQVILPVFLPPFFCFTQLPLLLQIADLEELSKSLSQSGSEEVIAPRVLAPFFKCILDKNAYSTPHHLSYNCFFLVSAISQENRLHGIISSAQQHHQNEIKAMTEQYKYVSKDNLCCQDKAMFAK